LVEIQKPQEYVVQFSRNHGGSPWLTGGDKHSGGVAEITVGMANSVKAHFVAFVKSRWLTMISAAPL